MPKRILLLTLFISLFLILSRSGEGAPATKPVFAAAPPAGEGQQEPPPPEAPQGTLAGVSVSPARVLPTMDDAPPQAAAQVVDARNPEWRATFGTEAGRQLIAPRPAPFLAPSGPPLDLNGDWDALSTSGSAGVVAMADAADGRLFAAISGDGLRVYAPGGNGVYGWSALRSNNSGLASNSVRALAVFEGELWAATGGAGISILNLEDGSWRTLTAANSGLPGNSVNSLTVVQPDSGRSFIWIGTQGSGAVRYGYNVALGDYIWYAVHEGTGLPDNGVRDVAVVLAGSEQRVFFSTDDGLARLVGSIWTYYNSGNTGDCALWKTRQLAVDDDNALWLATTIIVPAGPTDAPANVEIATGVCRMRQGFLFSTWEHFDNQSPGLPTNFVGGFSVDHAGRTWMAFRDYETGDGGAAVYDQGTWRLFEPPAEPLQSSDVRSVHAAGERVWFGDGGSAAFAIYAPNWLEFNGNAPVRTIMLEADDAWVGRAKQLAHHDGNNWSYFNPPLFLAEITSLARGDNVLYVGTSGEGIYPFSGGTFGTPIDSGQGLPSSDVRALEMDGDGRLWAGTGGGLALQADGYWLPFTAGTSQLLDDDVRALAADLNGKLWIATAGGISVLDIAASAAGEWSAYTMAEGLPANDVRALAAGPDGHIWAATAAGVAEWVPGTGTWQVHDAAGGALPGDDVLSIASDPVGRIWAGTTSGLALYEAGDWQHFHVPGSTLDADRIAAVASDGERLWAGAGNGVAVRGVLTGPIGFYIPEISSFTPTQGAPGTTVTISGLHFDDRGPAYNKVRFCCFSTSNWPYHEAHVISASSTELVVQVPPLAETGHIEVEAHGLTSEYSPEEFELAPVITDLGADCVALGSMIDIYGAGFTDGSAAAYVKIGNGPERLADYSDPNLVRQFIRPDDTAGPVRVRLLNGNSATSSKTITISRPELTGIEVQQGIDDMPMIWGKRTLVQVRLEATGGDCPAHVDGGKMQWVKTNNSTQTAAFAFFPSSAGFSVPDYPMPTAIGTTANFVTDFGYDGIFPLSQLAGGRITLTNGPVELMTVDVGTNLLAFTHIPDQVAFTLMQIAPANGTGTEHQAFWERAWTNMADVARAYPQRDIGWRWGSGSWIHRTPIWHSYGMVDLGTDDYDTIRDIVDDWVDPGGNNQAMGIIDNALDNSDASGKATMGKPTAVSFNKDGWGAMVFLQEGIHGMDWVQEWSPNHDANNETHSRYDEGERTDICVSSLNFRRALLDQLGAVKRVVRLRWAEDPYEFGMYGCDPANMPRSAMSYVDNRTNGSSYLEPVDYLFTLASIQSSAQQLQRAQAQFAPYAGDATLRLTGSISPEQVVSVRLSYLEPAGGDPSLPAPESDYRLQIRSAADELLYEQPFAAVFEGTHHGSDEGAAISSPFNLRVPFPDGASRAEIRHGADLLWSAAVSASAPTVSFTSPNGGTYDAGSPLPIAWNADDGDGDDLQFRLEYSADGGATWMLIAPYLEGDSFEWTPGHVPAGGDSRLRIQASDGFHTTSAVSAPFSLTPAAPWALISTPEEGAVFPEGKTINLAGSSTTSEGPHTGNFRWSRTDAAQELGTTPVVSYTLGGPGTYVFELEVTADGMSATETVSVTVIADYDHDGMPNDWELQYQLNPLNAVDALQDPDGDSVFNSDEYRFGTNPRLFDSDGDGDGDGDEIGWGSDPTEANQKAPDGPVLAVGAEALAYEAPAGTSNAGSSTFWLSNDGPGTLNWSAGSSAGWLTVTPGSGEGAAQVTIRASAAGLAPGTYEAEVTFTAPDAADSPQTIPVRLTVTAGGEQRLYLPIILR